MALKISMIITVQDSDHTRYDDPQGMESINFSCVSLEDVAQVIKEMAYALLRMAHVRFLEAIKEKKEEEDV